MSRLRRYNSRAGREASMQAVARIAGWIETNGRDALFDDE
jgi:hypothetical protein